MILAFLRLIAVAIVVMALFHVLIRVYSRSLRREKLEKRWAEEGGIGDRDAYVEEGLRRYDASIRPKLLILVYILPTIAICVLFYLINFT